MSVETINPEFSRISLLLQSAEKDQRRLGLKSLSTFLDLNPLVDEITRLWSCINRHLSRVLNDSSEHCREQAVELLGLILNILSPHDGHLRFVIPILSRRLGSPEQLEASEEVRLKCVILLRMIIPRYKDYLSPYMTDLIQILSHTIVDHYPLIKRESCSCVSEVARNLSKHFYAQSDGLIKPVLSNFAHQHHRVRIASVKAIGDLIHYGNSKSMEEVATPLAQRLFDQNSLVRRAVIEVAGWWLLELRDRYSWWHKVLPLLLTGLHDQVEEIREKASSLWDSVGQLYMVENQNDEKFKDKMDFLIEKASHYPNVSRPNLGCRVIVQRNFSKLVNGVVVELDDWLPDIRVRTAQLLCVMILNVEEDITQHIEKLLPSMYRACNNDDERVVENIDKAAEYLGYFVHPKIYCDLIIPTLETTLTPGHLRVFAAILKGSEANTLLPFLETIGRFLSQPHVCQSRDTIYQTQLLSCCHSLQLVNKEACKVIPEELFTVTFTVLSMATRKIVLNKAKLFLDTLAEVNSFKNIEELYNSYVRSLMLSFHDCKSWSVHNPECQIFCGCLNYAKKAVSANVDVVLTILKESTTANTDPDLRLKYFILWSEYFSQESCKLHELNGFLREFLKDFILPGLVWTAGRAAETIRTAAVCCLCTFLESYAERGTEKSQDCNLYFTEEEFYFLFDTIISVLLSLVDDASAKSRLYSLRAVCSVMSIGRNLNCIIEDHIHKVYFTVLKRLDDGCDEVRYASLETLVQIWSSVPKDYNVAVNRGHVDVLYTTMIIHLDDPEADFQDTMLESLKKVANVCPELLHQKLQDSKTNFRNQDAVNILLEHCQTILQIAYQ